MRTRRTPTPIPALSTLIAILALWTSPGFAQYFTIENLREQAIAVDTPQEWELDRGVVETPRLEEPPAPPPAAPTSASRVWVFPRFASDTENLRDYSYTTGTLLNPALDRANVSITYFTSGGALLLDPGRTLTLGAMSQDGFGGTNDSATVVVFSDVPILADGRRNARSWEHGRSQHRIAPIPVDCEQPGFEAICRFAR